MIDHAEVRAQLELAAIEPGGLERLAAGDTDDAMAVAGHLAGCPTCSEEARRLGAMAPIAREAARMIPPEALRERTLAFVRETGRPRPAAAPVAEGPVGPDVPGAPAAPRLARAWRGQARWVMLAAAALVVSLVAGGVLVTVRLGQDVRDQEAVSAGLASLHEATLRVASAADARRIALSGAAEPTVSGELLFSPASREIVMSATGLTEPAAGQKLACWLIVPDGSRYWLGAMRFGGGLAYWAGWSDELAEAGPGTTFQATLVGADGQQIGGDVLVGSVSVD